MMPKIMYLPRLRYVLGVYGYLIGRVGSYRYFTHYCITQESASKQARWELVTLTFSGLAY